MTQFLELSITQLLDFINNGTSYYNVVISQVPPSEITNASDALTYLNSLGWELEAVNGYPTAPVFYLSITTQ